jgi:hypothetical protein
MPHGLLTKQAQAVAIWLSLQNWQQQPLMQQ